MADLVAFSELPLQLVFKVRQLKNQLPNDTVNQVLTDGLNESALYLELNINVPSPKKQTKNVREKPNEKNDKYNMKLLYPTVFIPRFA